MQALYVLVAIMSNEIGTILIPISEFYRCQSSRFVRLYSLYWVKCVQQLQ